MFFTHIFVTAAVFTVCSSVLPINYYQTLWDDYYAKSDAWRRQTQKNQWKGSLSEDIKDFGTYNYIILGGGTGGAVLAKRLSENKNWNILVLEAGVDESPSSRMPAAAIQTKNSDRIWGYLTTPQKKACLGMQGNKCSLTTSKSLGGATAVNNMHYIRGNKADYDNWQAIGCSGWSYANVLPYFYKAEGASLPFTECHYHNSYGPWSVTFPIPEPTLTQQILSANEELGAEILDYNAAVQIGASRTQVNTYRGRRHSTNQAYLRTCSNQENIRIVTGALIIKIEYNENLHVESVIFLNKGATFRVHVDNEVIISLGTIDTPQLLLLSGIGPQKDLQELDIPCGADLPVGYNLRDQISYNLYFSTGNCTIPRTTFQEDWRQYIRGEGKLSTPIGQVVAFADTCGKGIGCPDAQLTYTVPNKYNIPKVIRKLENYKVEIENVLQHVDDAAIQVTVTLLHPKSSGTVKLKSTDPLDFPLIDPNYLGIASDVDDLYKSIHYALKLVDTNSFRNLEASLIKVELNNCKHLSGRRLCNCLSKNWSVSGKNPSGTCRMGHDTSKSVVGVDLMVHGFDNLRIADASVFPTTISSNDNSAAVVMIAEKLADLIKKNHNCM